MIGPESDPAGVADNAADDAIAAFTDIMNAQATFVSRADESGTHTKELSIWEAARSDSFRANGTLKLLPAEMGDVITMADEMGGYTLADRATWLNVGGDTGLTILCEKDPDGILYNQYGVI